MKKRLNTVFNSHLISEWDYSKNTELDPKCITLGSHKKVWWKCEKGHEWEATANKRNRGDNCPYCSGHRLCKDNSLTVLNPSLAKEWHQMKNGDLTPNDVMSGSRSKVWWQCSRGHEWKALMYTRNQGTGCPFCSGRKVYIDNCFATLNPLLVKEWHTTKNGCLTPYDVTSKSHKKVWWICIKGHEWKTSIDVRARGRGCPICSRGPVSKISQAWLDSLNIPAENREVWLGKLNLRVDGFDPETNTVYEFLGDYWHGNPNVYDSNDKNSVNKKTFGQLYEETETRISRLEEKGYKVVFIWESDFKRNK
jgi:hypothetical protein